MSVTTATDPAIGAESVVPGTGAAMSYHQAIRYHVARRCAPGKRVLDLAAGDCDGAAALARVAAEVTAVDPSERAIRRAAESHAGLANLTPRWANPIRFLESAEEARYDVVLAFEVLDHLADAGQRSLVAAIRRIVAPGGMLLVSVTDRSRSAVATGARDGAHALDARETELLLRRAFPCVTVLRQTTCTGAVLGAPGALVPAELLRGAWSVDGRAPSDLGAAAADDAGGLLLAVASDVAPGPDLLQPVVVADVARQLVAEELEAARRALEVARGRDRLQAVATEEDVSDLRRRLAAIEAVAERLALAAARVQDDVTRLQRVESRLRDTEHALFHLRRMLGVRVVLKAKSMLDGSPRLQRIVKAVTGRLR